MPPEAAPASRRNQWERWAGPSFAVALAVSLLVLFAPSTGGVSAFPQSDKLVHLAVFALLTATARWRFGPAPVLLAPLATYAVASEVVQARVLADRSGDPIDVVADLLGVALGWVVAARLR